MKQFNKIWLLSFLFCAAHAKHAKTPEPNNDIYKQEFRTFEKLPNYKAVFDEEAHADIKSIQRDIENFKELSLLQRLMRFNFLGMDVMVVTPNFMPSLYAYVDNVCQQNSMQTPTVFITTGKGCLNSAAQKLLASTGAIVIGRKLILKTTDDELEAVLAHEIGHIKYNHVNKGLLLGLVTFFGSYAGIDSILNQYLIGQRSKSLQASQVTLAVISSLILNRLIINKRFEKEADKFAYDVVNKGDGLVKFFKRMQKKEESEEKDFENTYFLIQQNKSKLSFVDYIALMGRYYMAKGGYLMGNAFKWFQHHTPFGAHPSLEKRITTIDRSRDKKI
jgi:Zn-dependent protease with chaperone function